MRQNNRLSQQRYRDRVKRRQQAIESEHANLNLQLIRLQAALTQAHKDMNQLRSAPPPSQELEQENAALKAQLSAEKAENEKLCGEVNRLKGATVLYRSAVRGMSSEIATLRGSKG